MPNHVKNVVQISGSANELKKLEIFLKSENPFDFQKIKPMPESLNCESGSMGDMALLAIHKINASYFKDCDIEYLKAKNQFSKLGKEEKKKLTELANTLKFNLENYGHKTWYSWSIENWGTKWNSYHHDYYECNENEYIFDTAWSSPIPVIAELSNLFPNVKIKLIYADEDRGRNTGKIVFEGGKMIKCVQPQSQSKKGYDIYFELNPEEKEFYKLVNGEWVYQEMA